MAKGIEWTAADDNSANSRRAHITPTAPPLHNHSGDSSARSTNHTNNTIASSSGATSARTPLLPVSARSDDSVVHFLVNGTDTLSANREQVRLNSPLLFGIITATSPTPEGFYLLPEIVDVALFGAVLKFLDTRTLAGATADDDDGDDDDVSLTLRQLEYAKRYECERMVKHCVQTLDAALSVSNAVDMYKSLRFHVLHAQIAKCKQPLAALTSEQAIEALMYNVLQFIDQHAEVVLQMDEIFDAALNFTDVDCILNRETLQVSEVVVYNFLVRWSRTECQRRNWEITAENRRRILGPMIYIPRFLLMSAKEFDVACQRAEILSADEQKLVADWFANNGKSSSLNDEQTVMMTRFRQARPKFARMPLHLSNRSSPKNYSSKMRKNERKLDDDGTNSWLYWFFGCYAFVCD